MEKPKDMQSKAPFSQVTQCRDNIPPSIAESKQFFIMRGSAKTDTPAGWNDPSNWHTLDEIPNNKYFGYVLSSTVLGIDGDHIIVDGVMIPEAKVFFDTIEAISDTYTELSVSGTGKHALVDLGDYADCFPSISNGKDQIILLTMSLDQYEQLSAEEQKKAPKIELFYKTGGKYFFLTGNTDNSIEVAEGEAAAEIFRYCLKMVDKCHKGSAKAEDHTPNIKSADEKTVKQVKEWLKFIDPGDRDLWIKIGIALYNSGCPFEIWDEWSKQSDKYNDGKDETTEKKWKGFSRSKSKWNIGTVCTLAKEGGWKKEDPAGKNKFDIQLVSGRELQKMELPPIYYPVESIIPQGYTVASAPFKYGKSWFALEMCLAIAQGSDFLGQKTTKGSSIYLALEDCDRFAQERLNMVLDGAEAPEGFYYIYNKVPTLDDGFIEYLDQLYSMVSNIKLVVIDILGLIEYQLKRGETAYKCDYRTGTALKQWADDHNTSVLAITHTTKMIHPNDVFMNTTGTSGVTGSADAILTIAKEKRTDKDAILAITGRRVREKYFKVHLKDGYIWETEGEVDPDTMKADTVKQEQEARLYEYRTNEIRKAIIKIVNLEGNFEATSREILNKARDHDVYLLCEVIELGGFICKYQNYFYTEDGIKIFIQKRGTASNVYKFIKWDEVSEEAISEVEKMF